jgi:hypothetical protein
LSHKKAEGGGTPLGEEETVILFLVGDEKGEGEDGDVDLA